jgi:uncharacterized membrane protein YoaK (UPF0700 family)
MGGLSPRGVDAWAIRAFVYALLVAAGVIGLRAAPVAGETLLVAAATLLALALARPLSVTMERAYANPGRRERRS